MSPDDYGLIIGYRKCSKSCHKSIEIHGLPPVIQSPWSFRFASGDAKAKTEMSSENLSVISPGNHGGLYNYYIYIHIIHMIYIHVILKLYIMYDI